MKKVSLMLALLSVSIIASFGIAGNLEPPGTPETTMKTLDDIAPTWSTRIDDSSRFKAVMGGDAILDRETGLIWSKNANIITAEKWTSAYIDCLNLTIGGRKGWRMPTTDELTSLLDMSQSGSHKLPTGHPFTNVQTTSYWTENETVVGSNYYIVNFTTGDVTTGYTSDPYAVWPVRGK